MNEKIKKLAEQADDYADAMDYLGKNYIGLRDNYFAELILLECAELSTGYTGNVKLLIMNHFGIKP